ncbi:androgen-induced gene 1 protein-like isoform X2 [Gigantopelta aegis]|uniref:androgen-induced gene 1 protein-like isoform X2 n=1 Tax=Gigantopelta aegis TaxID=1735272 RepID=UPI001B88DE9F|nr:androgen-induced gene 1 protein-like isoform X2 [Gigantopelta aegis]
MYNPTGHDGYAGNLKYLTFWNEVLQTFYFGLCTVNAVFGSNVDVCGNPRTRSKLQKWKDYLHTTLVFPVGAFVVGMFWSIYVVDRELVYPRKLDAIIPQWLNHVMHTTVLPILLVEKMLTYHHLPRRRSAISGLVLFCGIYFAWIMWVAYYADLWVYGILRVMEVYQRAIFILFCLMFFISIYLVGEALTKFIWRNQKKYSTSKLS